MKKCKCPNPSTEPRWVERPHKSGSLRLAGRTALAQVCVTCQGLVKMDPKGHTKLILSVFGPRKRLTGENERE